MYHAGGYHPRIPGSRDLDGHQTVDAADLLVALSNYSSGTGDCAGNIAENQIVNLEGLLILLSESGEDCSR